MIDINLDYYKIFYYVGKKKSITQAAEELSLSQPAVSQAIKNLEKNLGCSLFVRMSKGVRLTTEGEVLFQYVERGYESILSGQRKLLDLLELNAGEICIGASDMTLEFYLLNYLEQFHEIYPDIKVTVTNAPTPETMKHLADGKIDFGVVSTPIEEDKGLQVIPVRDIQDIFIVGKKFRHLCEKKHPYSILESLPVMSLEGKTSTRKYVEAFLMEEGVSIQPEFELATSDMLVQFAKRNLGVASVVEDFAGEAIRNKEVFRLPFHKDIPKRQICIIYNEQTPMSTAAKSLLRMLQDK